MNRREFVVSTLTGVVGLSGISLEAGQAKTITPDLGALADAKSLKLQPGVIRGQTYKSPKFFQWFQHEFR